MVLVYNHIDSKGFPLEKLKFHFTTTVFPHLKSHTWVEIEQLPSTH